MLKYEKPYFKCRGTWNLLSIQLKKIIFGLGVPFYMYESLKGTQILILKSKRF